LCDDEDKYFMKNGFFMIVWRIGINEFVFHLLTLSHIYPSMSFAKGRKGN